jgi:hypothetical protein
MCVFVELSRTTITEMVRRVVMDKSQNCRGHRLLFGHGNAKIVEIAAKKERNKFVTLTLYGRGKLSTGSCQRAPQGPPHRSAAADIWRYVGWWKQANLGP